METQLFLEIRGCIWMSNFFFLKLSSFYLFLTAFCPYYQGPPCMGPGPYLSCGIIDTMLLNLNVIKKNNEPWDRSPGPCDPN